VQSAYPRSWNGVQATPFGPYSFIRTQWAFHDHRGGFMSFAISPRDRHDCDRGTSAPCPRGLASHQNEPVRRARPAGAAAPPGSPFVLARPRRARSLFHQPAAPKTTPTWWSTNVFRIKMAVIVPRRDQHMLDFRSLNHGFAACRNGNLDPKKKTAAWPARLGRRKISLTCCWVLGRPFSGRPGNRIHRDAAVIAADADGEVVRMADQADFVGCAVGCRRRPYSRSSLNGTLRQQPYSVAPGW